MKDERITLKTAKLLKEKNFNIWAYGSITEYVKTQKDPEYPEGGGPFGWERGVSEVDSTNWFCNNHGACDYSNKKYKMYADPTQALVARWLREVHGIQVYVDSRTKNGENKWRDYVVYINGAQLNDPRDEEYDTYEKAMEFGLYNALTQIR
jgi:hypothetical protein